MIVLVLGIGSDTPERNEWCQSPLKDGDQTEDGLSPEHPYYRRNSSRVYGMLFSAMKSSSMTQTVWSSNDTHCTSAKLFSLGVHCRFFTVSSGFLEKHHWR